MLKFAHTNTLIMAYVTQQDLWTTADPWSSPFLPFSCPYGCTYASMYVWRHRVCEGAVIRRQPGTLCNYWNDRQIIAVASSDWQQIVPVFDRALVRALKQLPRTRDGRIEGYFLLSYTTESSYLRLQLHRCRWQ